MHVHPIRPWLDSYIRPESFPPSVHDAAMPHNNRGHAVPCERLPDERVPSLSMTRTNCQRARHGARTISESPPAKPGSQGAGRPIITTSDVATGVMCRHAARTSPRILLTELSNRPGISTVQLGKHFTKVVPEPVSDSSPAMDDSLKSIANDFSLLRGQPTKELHKYLHEGCQSRKVLFIHPKIIRLFDSMSSAYRRRSIVRATSPVARWYCRIIRTASGTRTRRLLSGSG